MTEKLKGKGKYFGLVFTIAVGIVAITLTWFLNDPDMMPFLFDLGIDAMGAFICAALYYGCIRQEGEGVGIFRGLNVLVSAAFLVQELMYFTLMEPALSTWCFIFCILSKLIDLVMIILFYMYIKKTLDLKGKLVNFTDKIIPFLLVFECIIVLSNVFYPTTFMIDDTGMYQTMGLAWTEDILLIVLSALTIVLIIRCDSPRNQKTAALLFIFLPIFEYISVNGSFGNAGQYGFVLMSLIIMYCIIFNEKSIKLASTQTELNLATDIQASMLPSIFPAFPNREEFDLHASMDPAKEVGGDFYDFFMIDDDHLGMVIADVSGKGVPAALFMMSSKILISDHALMGGSPSEILARVNKQICETNKANMFVTVWLGILEISTGKLTTANAGHEYPMINVNGRYELLKDKHGIAIGVLKKAKYTEHELTLKKGDSIFVYTDGVAEATDSKDELFGTDRTLEALNSLPQGASQKEVLQGVRAAVDAFVKEAPQFDDLTMVGFKYYGPGGKEE